MASLTNEQRRQIAYFDRMRSRLSALARVFAKTDRILTGRRDVNVKMSTTVDTKVLAPGFSDGTHITINTDRIPDINKAVGLVRLSAVNYHELSHLLFTPTDIGFRQQIVSEGLHMAFNILEDQRIETLFVAKYRPAAKYFAEMNVVLFVQNPKAWPTAMFFTHGRRYLPLEVRERLDDLFAGSDHAKSKAKRIIDEYRLLSLTTQSDLDRAMTLIQEFAKVIKEVQDDGHQVMGKGDDDGEGTCTDPRGQYTGNRPNRRLSEDAAEQAKEDTEEQDETEAEGEDGSGFWDDVLDDEDDTDEEADDESASGSGDDDGEEDDGDWDDSEDDEGESSGNADGDDSDFDADDDGDSEGEGDSDSSDGGAKGRDGSHGIGTGFDEDEENVAPDLDDLIREVLESIRESEDVQNDINTIRSAMDEAKLELDATEYTGTLRPVTADEMIAMQRTEREYMRLYAKVEPGWMYGSDHGRLNVQRAIESASVPGYDTEDLFDEWDEGREDETGIEAFFSADLSGSLMSQSHQLSSALWVMKRPLDSIDAQVSVAGFHSRTFTLCQRGEKFSPTEVNEYFANGSNTQPVQSMKIARRVMSQSQMPNRLFVILTDGAWSAVNNEDDGLDETEREMFKQSPYGSYGFSSVSPYVRDLIESIDAVRVFVGIGGATNAYPDSFHHEIHVDDISEIPEKIRPVITTMLNNVITNSRRHV